MVSENYIKLRQQIFGTPIELNTMTKQELINFINKENLPVNLYLEHPIQEYEIVLNKKHNKYIVYTTNERAGQQGITSFFDNELDALNDAIMKSCILKKRYHNQ